jgi:hypothetical protein
MNQRHQWGHEPLFDRFARRLTADGDTPAGGAAAPAAASPPADGGAAPDAGGAPPAPAAGDPPPPPKSLLTDAKVPDEPKPAPVVPETPEQKAERLKNETPAEKESA